MTTTQTQAALLSAHWYSIDKHGAATLCVDEDDAKATAIDSQTLYPHNGPYRAVQMAPIEPVQAGELPDEREAHATARAFSLATVMAEEFVRCNGLPTGNSDEFLMTGPDLTDEHATACVDHLKWVGECVAFDTDDGVLVRLGDFTLGSLS